MKFLSLLMLCLILCPVALAQEYPRSEFFGGYSLVRTDREDVDLTQFGAVGTASRKAATLNGWNISITGNPTSKFGVVADFGGAYGSIGYSLSGVGSLSARSRFHSFLFGPQFYLRGDRATGFFRGLAGAVKLDQSVNLLGFSRSQDETAFGAGVGGGMDLKWSSRISVRAFQVDYVLTRFDGGGVANNTQHSFRVSTGFVFRNRD